MATAKIGAFFQKSRVNKLIAITAGVSVLVAGYLIAQSGAAGFFAAVETDQASLSGKAQVVSDASAANGKAIRFGTGTTTTPTPPAPPAPPTPPTPPPTAPPSTACNGTAKPGPTNTGPSGTLTQRSGLTITTDGTVLENVLIKGTVTIKANNVTLRNFAIDAGNSAYAVNATFGKTNLLLERGELYNVSSAHIYGANFTARCLNLHTSGSDAIKPTTNAVVERSWFHHLGMAEGSHADATQSRWGGSNLIYRYNNCDIPTGVAGHNTNACFILEKDGGPINGVIIENNWLNGGNYTIYCEDTPGIVLKNNRFGRNYRYGIMQGCPKGTGNVWDDTGQSI